ncbi:MAG: AAA-type ATPase lid domain-containing protein, partial [Mucilaginibacter sp.]
IRLIVATHANLAEEVRKGNFREDLYYRILGLPIELPPLRTRGNDVLILAKHFADDFTLQNKLGHIMILQDAKDKLMRYNYPGNVRELKAIVDLAAVMCDNNEIKADDITFNSVSGDVQFGTELKTLREYTIDIIKYYLKKNNNDVLTTAKDLDIGKSTIYKMMQSGELE